MNGPGEAGPVDDDADPVGGIEWLEGGPIDAPAVACWRCGKTIVAASTCPFCRAPISGEARRLDPRRPASGARVPLGDPARFMPVFALYLAFLATSVVYGWTTGFGLPRNVGDLDEQLASMLVVELVDTALVVAGIAWATRPPAPPPRGRGTRIAAWVLSALGLVALLGVNMGYHRVLRGALGLPDVRLDLFDRPGRLPWIILGLCAQPAIVEELFFRYLALGHLRPLLGSHGAVLVSSAMFGLAHIFAVLSAPYLILAGIAFGYARLYGRSLALPMLLHFAHNLAILRLEPWL